jgi:tetratricopeptide (TPR) repeat protein
MWEEYELLTVQNPTDSASFQEMVQHADASYLSNRLRLICMAYAQRQVYKTSLDALDLPEIVALAERPEWEGTPAVSLYLACYRMLRQPDQVAWFHTFTRMLKDVQPVFEDNEMRGLYLQAINYCIRRLNNGEDHFFQEVLLLYQSALTNGYLLEQGILSRFAYHNIVAAGLHVGELEWVNSFIHTYKGQLERKYRESSFSFNLARLEYQRKRYDAVLELLQKANYRDPLLNLAARTLLLKTWYELGEFELLQSHLDAMRSYVQRKQVIGYHKANYLNIIRYADRIMKVNMNDEKAVAALRKAITNEEVLTEKDWLLACLEAGV